MLVVNMDGKLYVHKTKDSLQLYGAHAIKDFIQPILTSNGVIGGNSFACGEEAYFTEVDSSEQRFYRLFDDTSHEWQINAVDVNRFYWGKFYNPNPMILSKIEFMPSELSLSPARIKIYSSNNNVDWVQLGEYEFFGNLFDEFQSVPLKTERVAYRYFRVDVQPRNSIAVMLRKIRITAKEIV